jgi:hypothetical protein
MFIALAHYNRIKQKRGIHEEALVISRLRRTTASLCERDTWENVPVLSLSIIPKTQPNRKYPPTVCLINFGI